MKAKELRDLSSVDLASKLKSLKEELFNLRFQMATGHLENPARIREVRHDIARVLTVMREKQVGEARKA